MVIRWDLITIGNISRNRYWGESDEKGVRPPLCTCTLVRGDTYCLLVDPSIQDETAMAFELNRRSGLRPADITHVFMTHPHGDHHFGLRHFPAATWLAAAPVAADINREAKYAKPVAAHDPAARLLGDLELLHTPGHTEHHYSLRFTCEGLSIIIAGDAAMTPATSTATVAATSTPPTSPPPPTASTSSPNAPTSSFQAMTITSSAARDRFAVS